MKPQYKLSVAVTCNNKLALLNKCCLSGMPQTSGLVMMRDYRASEDAPVVGRLRQAGLIPTMVTNVSELCMWYESANRLNGRSCNPYNTSRIVGGSSGED